MSIKKLFSSEAKAKLAGLKIIYAHNRERTHNSPIYMLQAAEAAWEMCDIFIAVAKDSELDEHLMEVIKRVKDNLSEVILLNSKDFVHKKAELIGWLQKRLVKASSTVRRLRKVT